MINLYNPTDANYPRIKTDQFFANYNNTFLYDNFLHDTIQFLTDCQLKNPQLWKRFVEQFRNHGDTDFNWRGEYWGKTMRAACFVYAYSKDPSLYQQLTLTVKDILDCEDDLGRICSYPLDMEFDGWDIWCRKYVLLGLQYFLEISTDSDLSNRIIESMIRQVNYITSKIGPSEEGKKEITAAATQRFDGVNASSLLEPIVRLYIITKDQRFLDFAEYIADTGGISSGNLIELALSDNIYPYQYPVTKAYEMISFFEGLLELYRVTDNEKYKQAVIRFADKVLESDFTVIGSCGCTHELFDHSTVRQTEPHNGTQQETCVTVTMMKLMYQLTLLTGDSKYADAFEISLYNAYLGSVNTSKSIAPYLLKDYPDWAHEPLPFDSYSPLTAGSRGIRTGGLQLMSDNHYYGCCACIGSAGIGLVPKMHVLTTHDGFAMNLYISGTVRTTTPLEHPITFVTNTQYPKNETVEITLHMEQREEFTLLLRNPGWSKNTKVFVNGSSVSTNNHYFELRQSWKDGDCITIQLDMRTKVIYPFLDGSIDSSKESLRAEVQERKYIALQRGPIMLAQASQLGYNLEETIQVGVNQEGNVFVKESKRSVPYPHILAVDVPLTNGKVLTVTDYASAGKLWSEEDKVAVWMLTE